MRTRDPQQRIARRIRALREQAGLTQAGRAKRLGFNDGQTLAAIEAGERRLSPDEFVQTAEALGAEGHAYARVARGDAL